MQLRRVDVTDDWDDVQLGECECAEGAVTGADVSADVTVCV